MPNNGTKTWLSIWEHTQWATFVDRIARIEAADKERAMALKLANDKNAEHFIAINGLQQKMDKAQETFATKKELGALQRFIYIAIGLGMAAELYLRYSTK